MSRRDLQGARKHLDDVLRLQSNNRQALELLLEIDMAQPDRLLAEQHVEKLLTLDPRNAVGNLVLGSIQYARREYELAEASYRTSLLTRRSDRALNDLAWILQLKGRYEEASKLVREAIQLNPKNASAWDTLGIVSLRLNRVDDAADALQKALSYQPGNPQYILHMAQIYEKKGLREEALSLADPLLSQAALFDPDAYEELRALIKRLRPSS